MHALCASSTGRLAVAVLRTAPSFASLCHCPYDRSKLARRPVCATQREALASQDCVYSSMLAMLHIMWVLACAVLASFAARTCLQPCTLPLCCLSCSRRHLRSSSGSNLAAAASGAAAAPGGFALCPILVGRVRHLVLCVLSDAPFEAGCAYF